MALRLANVAKRALAAPLAGECTQRKRAAVLAVCGVVLASDIPLVCRPGLCVSVCVSARASWLSNAAVALAFDFWHGGKERQHGKKGHAIKDGAWGRRAIEWATPKPAKSCARNPRRMRRPAEDVGGPQSPQTIEFVCPKVVLAVGAGQDRCSLAMRRPRSHTRYPLAPVPLVIAPSDRSSQSDAK